jgi:phosphoglycerate kinase
MPVTDREMLPWCEALLAGREAAPDLKLADYLRAIPTLDALADLPSGTTVLVRGDVDAKPGAEVGEGDVRLRSMVETLKIGRQRGWKQVVFGHIGRKPEGTLSKVAKRLGALLDCNVPLIEHWLDEVPMTISSSAAERVAAAEPGAVLMLENTRKYDIERVLWKAEAKDLPQIVPRLTRLANQFAEKLGTVYVFEALSAGSLDATSVAVPAAMDRVALGRYVASEFSGPMMRCLEAQLVVFSGLKTDKLDDLEAIISRGKVRWVLAAGSLAMALKKAAAELEGRECCLGVADDPDHRDQPYYISPDRVEQAGRMIADGRQKGIQFVLPVDAVITDGSTVGELGPADQQFDVGPKTSALFEEKVGEFIKEPGAGSRESGAGGRESASSSPPTRGEGLGEGGKKIAFHNGVFGMFEDPKFEEGTRRFVSQLKRMKDAGVEVYIGGGEGGKALEQYGQPDWVTHVFTAGGTVLNALGNEPVPYLVALRIAAEKTPAT